MAKKNFGGTTVTIDVPISRNAKGALEILARRMGKTSSQLMRDIVQRETGIALSEGIREYNRNFYGVTAPLKINKEIVDLFHTNRDIINSEAFQSRFNLTDEQMDALRR